MRWKGAMKTPNFILWWAIIPLSGIILLCLKV